MQLHSNECNYITVIIIIYVVDALLQPQEAFVRIVVQLSVGVSCCWFDKQLCCYFDTNYYYFTSIVRYFFVFAFTSQFFFVCLLCFMATQLSALLSSPTFLHSASSAPLSSQIFSDKQHQKQEKTSAAYQMYALIKKSKTKTF